LYTLAVFLRHLRHLRHPKKANVAQEVPLAQRVATFASLFSLKRKTYVGKKKTEQIGGMSLQGVSYREVMGKPVQMTQMSQTAPGPRRQTSRRPVNEGPI
jgi:hypothetical protein